MCFKVRKEDEKEKYAASVCWFARAGTTRWILTCKVAPRDSACAVLFASRANFSDKNVFRMMLTDLNYSSDKIS